MKAFAFERRWMQTIADAVLPSGKSDKLPIGARDVPLDRMIEDLFATASTEFLLGLRAAIWLAYLGGPALTLRRRATLGDLPPDERTRVLRELADSRIYFLRELPFLLKTVTCLGYVGTPEVQSSMGIPHEGDRPSWMGPK